MSTHSCSTLSWGSSYNINNSYTHITVTLATSGAPYNTDKSNTQVTVTLASSQFRVSQQQLQHLCHCHTCQFTVQGQPTTVTTFKSLSHLPHKLAQKPATAKIFLLYPQTAFNRSWLQHLTQSVQKLERNPALQQSTSELTMLKNIFLNNGAPVLPGRACTDRVYLYCRAGPALTESTCTAGPGRACTDRVYLYCRAGPALTESPTCDKG